MLKRIPPYLIVILAVCGIWEYFGRTHIMVSLLISSPSLVCKYSWEHAALLSTATGFTLAESLIGLLLAVLFSFGVMVLCFYFPPILNVIMPVMVTSQVIPLITLAPLLIMAFGIGLTAKIVMAALLCFFPLFVNFASGYGSIPNTTKELLYLYGAPTSFRIVRVYVPLSLPSILAGLKVSATLSVIGAIVAEFNGADYGLAARGNSSENR
jgi:NitT/TauT family transport system permease protein